jgi:hypothetical protein
VSRGVDRVRGDALNLCCPVVGARKLVEKRPSTVDVARQSAFRIVVRDRTPAEHRNQLRRMPEPARRLTIDSSDFVAECDDTTADLFDVVDDRYHQPFCS